MLLQQRAFVARCTPIVFAQSPITVQQAKSAFHNQRFGKTSKVFEERLMTSTRTESPQTAELLEANSH